MKSHWNQLKHIILSLTLVVSPLSLPTSAFAQTDTSLDDQKAACQKNTAAEWSASMNKCIGKVDAKNTRHEVEDCSSLTDINQRKECHKKIAEKKTGLNSDPDSLPDGNIGKSAIMNGAASAYAILGMINGLGAGKNKSMCTSKKIFAVTALAGTATDIWLKIQAKKKLNALKDKYQIDVKNNAFDAQSKAFVYLKDEQETVKDIASSEKKRNMLLMLGYGAAALMALYEMTPMGSNPDCVKKEEDKKEEKKEERVCDSAEIQNADGSCSPGTPPDKEEAPACDEGMVRDGAACVGKIREQGKVETRELEPLKEEAPAPAAVAEQKPTPTTVTAEAQKVEAPAPTPAAAPKDKYIIEQRNGVSQIRSVDADGIKTDRAIVGNKIIDYKSGKVLGTVNADQIEISRVGTSSPISASDYKKYGVYQSGATDSASQIKFINSGTGTRTNVNGTTTTINDSKIKLKGGK